MEPSFIEAGRWVRGEEDLALRLRVGDARESLPGGVTVEPGVAGLLVGREGPVARLSPGDYALEALLAQPALRSGQEIDLVLVKTGSVALPFALREVAGKNGATATLSFDLGVEIASAPKLVSALLPEPGRMLRESLMARLHADVRAAADAVVGRESLAPELEAARIGAMLEGALASVGAGSGVRVTRVGGVRLELDAPEASEAPDAAMSDLPDPTQWGEVALPEDPGGAPELESGPPGAGRDPEREREIEQSIELDGISPEALAQGAGRDDGERSVPLPQGGEAAAAPGAVRCSGCGSRMRPDQDKCPQCATPAGA